MKKPIQIILNCYDVYYRFIAAPRLQKGDLDPRAIHNLTVTVICTSPLMFAYAFLAYFEIASPIPGIVGLICAGVHLLSPILFRFTNHTFFLGSVVLGSGIIHQSTFSFYSGGFMSLVLKWLPILPLLAGVVTGVRGAGTWGFVTLLVSGGFLVADQMGFIFPYLISPKGLYIANILIQFGFIIVCVTVISIAVTLQNNAEVILHDQRKKIDDLFKVLFHDLANPLGRMGIGLNLIKKQQVDSQVERGLQIITHASESMLEITQNVRRMYAVSKGKADVDLVPTPLNESVEYLQQLFAHELAQKNLSLVYHFDRHEGLKLLVEPVSFKNQVLANIISNAVKFSNPGGQIHIEATEVQDKVYALQIRDEGMGIPQNIIPDLFDSSKSTNRKGTMGEKGSGFGLQIMKSFVEMYGGEISIKSIEHKGTTFIVTLKGMR